MWPFKKKLLCNHSEILTDWLEDGENDALPDDEQRVYDAFMLLRGNYDYWYHQNSPEFISVAASVAGVQLILSNHEYVFGAEAFRKGFFVQPKLPKVVVQFMVSALLNDHAAKKRKDIDSVWPLPTKWDKPKKQKKAK